MNNIKKPMPLPPTKPLKAKARTRPELRKVGKPKTDQGSMELFKRGGTPKTGSK